MTIAGTPVIVRLADGDHDATIISVVPSAGLVLDPVKVRLANGREMRVRLDQLIQVGAETPGTSGPSYGRMVDGLLQKRGQR